MNNEKEQPHPPLLAVLPAPKTIPAIGDKSVRIAVEVVTVDHKHMPHGAPAYTDGRFAYVGDHVKERDVAERHECAHIWLQHFRRRKLLKAKEEATKRVFQEDVWMMAADLEIAAQIYDEQDEIEIAQDPVLCTGVTSKLVKQFKSRYAEDFYLEIMRSKSPAKRSNCSHDGHANLKAALDKDDKDAQGKGDKDKDDKGKADKDAKGLNVPSIVRRAQNKADEQRLDAAIGGDPGVITIAPSAYKRRPSLASYVESVMREALDNDRTYARQSRRPGMPPVVLKGKKRKGMAPKVNVYLDRSGSFNSEKTRTANDAVKRALSRYRGRIKRDVFVFSDEVAAYDDPGFCAGGGTAYDAVVEHINRDKPMLAVVITDDDSTGYLDLTHGQKCVVIPVGCSETKFAKTVGAVEVNI